LGRLARVISSKVDKDGFLILTVETDYKNNIQVESFGPAGDCSRPLPEDKILLIEKEGSGEYGGVVVLNEDQNEGEGEKIIFSRDEDGNVVAQAYFQKDGKLDIILDSNLLLNINNNKIKVEANDDGKLNIETEDKITVKAKKDIDIDSDTKLILMKGTDFAVRCIELQKQLNTLKAEFNTFVKHRHFVYMMAGGAYSDQADLSSQSQADFTNIKVSNINVPAVGEDQ
jgi:hypothetical protein